MPPGAPSLKDLRRATADKVAPFELVRSGLEEAGTYVGTAFGGSRRRIVSSDLVSIDAAGAGPETPTDALKNEWLYVCSDPPEQRRVPEGGFVGVARADEALTGYDPALTPADAPVAYVDVSRPFSAVVAPGLEVEIHAIPPLRGGRSAGLHTAILHALRVMLRSDSVPVDGISGQTSIDVTATFPWLTNVGLFIGAQYVRTTAGVDTYAIPGATLRFDADAVLLRPNTTVSTGQQIPVSVLRPLATWVKPAGGAWGESATGPIADDDQVLGDTDAIALVAAFHVCEEQAQACVVGSAEQRFWGAQATALAARSAFLRDQRVRTPSQDGQPWPDDYSPYGRFGGRFGPGFR